MTRTSTGLVRGCNLSLSCHHLLPLPVIFVQLNDQERSRSVDFFVLVDRLSYAINRPCVWIATRSQSTDPFPMHFAYFDSTGSKPLFLMAG